MVTVEQVITEFDWSIVEADWLKSLSRGGKKESPPHEYPDLSSTVHGLAI